MLLVRILFGTLSVPAGPCPAVGHSEAANVMCSLRFHFDDAAEYNPAATPIGEVY